MHASLKWGIAPVVLGCLWGGYKALSGSPDKPEAVQAAASSGQTRGGQGRLGKPTTLTILVKSTYTTTSGKYLLNDSEDYQAAESKTVVIGPAVKDRLADSAEYMGKSIKVKGRTVLYHGRPQVVADTVTVE